MTISGIPFSGSVGTAISSPAAKAENGIIVMTMIRVISSAHDLDNLILIFPSGKSAMSIYKLIITHQMPKQTAKDSGIWIPLSLCN
jgi:hypothetical protein